MVNQYLGPFGSGMCCFFWVGEGGGGGCFVLRFFSVSLWEDECWQVDVGVGYLEGSRLEIMRFPSFAL